MKTPFTTFYFLSEKNYGKTADWDCFMKDMCESVFDKVQAFEIAAHRDGDIYIYGGVSSAAFVMDTRKSDIVGDIKLLATVHESM